MLLEVSQTPGSAPIIRDALAVYGLLITSFLALATTTVPLILRYWNESATAKRNRKWAKEDKQEDAETAAKSAISETSKIVSDGADAVQEQSDRTLAQLDGLKAKVDNASKKKTE